MSDETRHPHIRPRLAASLILTRKRRSETEVLLGRRSAGHVFMPDRYVFPGGRVDRADAYAPLAADLAGDVLDCMTRTMPERRARAAAAAAIRETAEETGLLLARPCPARSRHPAWRAFVERGLAPDPSPLRLVARAITPPGRVRRFDAWFFHADEAALLPERVENDNPELEDVRWIALGETAALPLPIITRFVLGELERLQADPDARPRHIREIARKMRLEPL
ncbi:MAG: NUDIX domain-containing protein [Maricaulaceae bacterium]|nr:NUDIX domain-containing protein [Maricaulaceae bacterium]